MNHFKNVLSPFKFGNVEVKNRIELAPACHMLASHDGFVTREMVAYYQNLARGGAGIITIGESPIDNEYAKDHEFQINLGDDKVINGLSVMAEAVHRYGAKLSIEINHSGRFKLNGQESIGPSPIPTELEEVIAKQQGRSPRPVIEMNQEMIDIVVDRYVQAAYRCLRAGFEMVMVHGGHGHLISQFLSPYSNKRTDRYGGSLENRARFACEVLEGIRKKVGNKLAIELRISANELVPGGMVEEDTIEFVKLIEDKIDLLHVSAGYLGHPDAVPHMIQPTYFPHGYNVHRAETLKKALNIPIATVGSIVDMEMAERIVAEGKADIVAMARAIFADPDIINKTINGQVEDIRPCQRCFTCNKLTRHFYPIRCAVNPVLGREMDYANILPANNKKKVVIIGGGPAGMQAALTASARGHEVVLYEKNGNLGGNLRLAAGLELKEDMRRYLSWFERQIMKTSGITVKMNNEASVEKIEAEEADAIIVAVGSDPILPNISGAEKANVVWVGDVDMGRAKVGEQVVIAGGGSTGAEAALQMAKDGKEVTIIDMLDYETLAADWPRGLSHLLAEYSVQIISEVKLQEISDQGAVVLDKAWQRVEIPADTIVLSFGFKPRTETVNTFKNILPNVYVIGDCVKPQDIKQAVHDGFNVAVEI